MFRSDQDVLKEFNRDIELSQGGDGIIISPGPINGVVHSVDDIFFAKASRKGESKLVIVHWVPFEYPSNGFPVPESVVDPIARAAFDIIESFRIQTKISMEMEVILNHADIHTAELILAAARWLVKPPRTRNLVDYISDRK